MFEKVSPCHPDKLADRIAGALVDLAYKQEDNPKVAVEVLLGHGFVTIINETSTALFFEDVRAAARRITGDPHIGVVYKEYRQDSHLAQNQAEMIRCGDNGIFKGTPVTKEQRILTNLAGHLYKAFPYDGKMILDDAEDLALIVCQSNAEYKDIWARIDEAPGELMGKYTVEINPLGDWTGGPKVDTGATNRKLGSDMGDSITGGGLHGKDLSKADVTLNICAWLDAQEIGNPVEMFCAIGDAEVLSEPYQQYIDEAREYIRRIGGFEKFAEWGLIRPEEE